MILKLIRGITRFHTFLPRCLILRRVMYSPINCFGREDEEDSKIRQKANKRKLKG
jgi:hypothetical protein